ncbi:hypothetical protein SCALM49S_01536 [Streptomyces californicus]
MAEASTTVAGVSLTNAPCAVARVHMWVMNPAMMTFFLRVLRTSSARVVSWKPFGNSFSTTGSPGAGFTAGMICPASDVRS